MDGAADICSHHGCRSSTQHATLTSSTCANKFRYLKEHRIKLSGTEILKPSADEFYASILPECSIQYNYSLSLLLRAAMTCMPQEGHFLHTWAFSRTFWPISGRPKKRQGRHRRETVFSPYRQTAKNIFSIHKNKLRPYI